MEKTKTTNGKNALTEVVTVRKEKRRGKTGEKRREHKVYYHVSGWKELKQRSD